MLWKFSALALPEGRALPATLARMPGAWGEDIIKLFVREAVDEALKLESALARLRTPQRIALLHYSPIEATVEGEPPTDIPSWVAVVSPTRCAAIR